MDRHEGDRLPIRVMIVEDTSVVRLLLEHIVSADDRFEVVASVSSGEEALQVIRSAMPDVISMDIRLPGMNGFEATHRIMATRPTPIVVVSASENATEELNISMNALRAGALSVVEKPVGLSRDNYLAVADNIRNQLYRMSQVQVITQRFRPDMTGGRTAGKSVATVEGAPDTTKWPTPAILPVTHLGIVASTGGPNAVATTLAGLGNIPLPILIVQHITAGFLPGFVAWLDSISPQPVTVATDGVGLRPGHVYVAPSGKHLECTRQQIILNDNPPVSRQKPSGTVLFQSMAHRIGPGAMGVLLTGMGDDGARGLRSLREKGGYTIAEHESTSVVHGMPGAAIRMGAAIETIPLPQIAARIWRIIQRSQQAN